MKNLHFTLHFSVLCIRKVLSSSKFSQFSSVQSLSRVRLFAIPWTAAHQASLSISNSRSSLKLTSIESVMPSSHLILCHPLLLLPPIPPSIRVFSKESTLCMRWPKYWSFSFSISPTNEHPGLIAFRMDWLGFLAVQGTLKSLLQHYSSKASILRCSAFSALQSSQSSLKLLNSVWLHMILVNSQADSGSLKRSPFLVFILGHILNNFNRVSNILLRTSFLDSPSTYLLTVSFSYCLILYTWCTDLSFQICLSFYHVLTSLCQDSILRPCQATFFPIPPWKTLWAL